MKDTNKCEILEVRFMDNQQLKDMEYRILVDEKIIVDNFLESIPENECINSILNFLDFFLKGTTYKINTSFNYVL